MSKYTVKTGIKFNYNYADTNVLWRVVRKAGPNIWMCRVIDKEYAGSMRAFFESDIVAIINEKIETRNKNKFLREWFDKLELGTIVHYYDGANQYVRCRVVDGVFESPIASSSIEIEKRSGKHLLPIALVGDWSAYDLPQRNRDGSIHFPYYANNVMHKKGFLPHVSHIVENPLFYKRLKTIPYELQPIDLNLPTMTPAQQADAERWQLISKVQEMLEEATDSLKSLNEVKTLLNKSL